MILAAWQALLCLLEPLTVPVELMLMLACLQPFGLRPVAPLVLQALSLRSGQAAPVVVRVPFGPTQHGALSRQTICFHQCQP